MTKLTVFLLLGLTQALPYRNYHGYHSHHAPDMFNPYKMYSTFKAFNPYNMYSTYNQHEEHKPVQHSSYAKPLGYAYMSHPMAQVPMAVPQSDSNYFQKMVGEQFFKHPGTPGHTHGSYEEDGEEVPYTLIQNYGAYEHREYPAANFACVKSEVDTSEDPMAGLENVDPLVLMGSKRWRKTPSSLMFKELFKYISGVNKDGQEVEMTRPVSTLHSVKQKQEGGDVEVQEMCFYVPAEHQANPPQPLENSPVYIRYRPSMRVYSHQFDGFTMTQATMQKQRTNLDLMLLGKPHHDNEYYINGYNSPFVQTNRRNEVWIQDLEPGTPVLAAVQAEVEEEEEEHQRHHEEGHHEDDEHDDDEHEDEEHEEEEHEEEKHEEEEHEEEEVAVQKEVEESQE